MVSLQLCSSLGRAQTPSPAVKPPDDISELEPFVVDARKPEPFSDANVDIPRTIDDVKPYFIFSQKSIEQSGAVSVEEFIRNRLSMNTDQSMPSQLPTNSLVSTSLISLRGLGATAGNQTLILVDGRRMAGVALGSSMFQPDLNGIPLAAVERIEVLPSSASGIYGGGAVAGVINVVMRRDYLGAELKTSYQNTFDSDTPTRSLDLTAGYGFERGRSNLTISAHFGDGKPLLSQDRDFVDRGRARILANYPAYFLASSSPPVGTTPNIRATSGTLFNNSTATITYVPVGYNTTAGLAPLLANAGSFNFNRPNSAQSGGLIAAMGSAAKVSSLMTTLRRRFTPVLDLFFQANYSRNHGTSSVNPFPTTVAVPATAPYNVFGRAVTVSVPFNTTFPRTSDNLTRRLIWGATLKLPHNWKAQADYTWTYSSFTTAAEVIDNNTPAAPLTTGLGNGTFNVLRDPSLFPLDLTPILGTSVSTLKSMLNNVALRATGPLWSSRAGAATLSTGFDHRKEGRPDGYLFLVYNTHNDITDLYLGQSQSTDSAYAELDLPLVSAANARRGIRELAFQFTGRVEDYHVNTVGPNGGGFIKLGGTLPAITVGRSRYRSAHPALGFRYRPLQDVMLRVSYSTGFRPPSYTELQPNALASSTTRVVDPRRGNTTVDVPFVNGGNPDLEPETSQSWNAGLVFEPRFLRQFRFAVDYTRLEKHDNIGSLSSQNLVNSEALFPGRITRGPVPTGDPYGVGPITFIDDSSVNLTKALVEAYDVSLDWRWTTQHAGTVTVYALATWQTHAKTQSTLAAPYVENVGISGSPLKFRTNGGLTWVNGRWTLGWSARYFNSYALLNNATNLLAQGSARVRDQLYHDAFFAYRLPALPGATRWRDRARDRVEVTVGVKNVFNSEPPLDVGNSAYFYSYYGDAKLRTYTLSLKKQF